MKKLNKFCNYLKIKTDKNHIKSLFTSKAFRVGSYSTFATIAVIAIAVVINMIVGLIPSKITKLDFTQNQFFTISEQTEQIVSPLNSEVDIYLLAQSGTEDAVITELLAKYQDLNNNIKVIKKDPVVYPNFAQQYTSDTIYNNSIIVSSNNRSKYISYNDIYVTDYSNYVDDSTYKSEFNGESCLTSAIDYVTNNNIPKIYTLAGNGEKVLDSTIQNSIRKENINIENLNLLTLESVPEDADCLFIYSPSRDISQTEKDKILTYLKSGGNMLLITDYSETDMPNLSEIAENYGVTAVDGIVIEGDSSKCVGGYNHYLLPNINNHTITAPLIDKGYYVLMPISQGIKQLESKRSTVSITDLLTTSSKAFSKSDAYNIKTMDKEDGDIEGPFALGVAITENIDDTQTNIVWYTTSQMLDNKVDQIVSGGNTDLLLNSLGWMCKKENTISIHAKSLDTEHLTVSSAATAYWSLIMIGVLPIIFIAIGIYVLIRRKKR